jgi:hypothetical protein
MDHPQEAYHKHIVLHSQRCVKCFQSIIHVLSSSSMSCFIIVLLVVCYILKDSSYVVLNLLVLEYFLYASCV